MDCPLCKSKGAYVGLNTVECPNRGCEAYEQKMEQKTRLSPMSRAAWQETLARIKAKSRGTI